MSVLDEKSEIWAHPIYRDTWNLVAKSDSEESKELTDSDDATLSEEEAPKRRRLSTVKKTGSLLSSDSEWSPNRDIDPTLTWSKDYWIKESPSQSSLENTLEHGAETESLSGFIVDCSPSGSPETSQSSACGGPPELEKPDSSSNEKKNCLYAPTPHSSGLTDMTESLPCLSTITGERGRMRFCCGSSIDTLCSCPLKEDLLSYRPFASTLPPTWPLPGGPWTPPKRFYEGLEKPSN